MIKIKKIKWLDETIKEALVLLSDGKFEILVFSHPFTLDLNENVKSKLYIFEPENICKTYKNENIERVEQLKHRIIGTLIEKGLIKVGIFKMEIDKFLIPSDIELNDGIEFTCERIDFY